MSKVTYLDLLDWTPDRGDEPNLIVPDVHEQVDTVYRVMDHFMVDVDHMWFLGDFFDSYTGRSPRTVDLLVELLNNNDVDTIEGNHDVMYLYANPPYHCSGFNMQTRLHVRENSELPELHHKMKPYGWVHGYLCTHAGLHPKRLPIQLADEHDPAKFVQRLDDYLSKWANDAWDGVIHDYNYPAVHSWFAIGKIRGGSDSVGGPIWLDFHHEFLPLPIVPQIVGHTRGKTVREIEPADPAFERNGRSDLCLDTGLKHVAVVYKDGGVDVCKLPIDWVEGDGRG